MREHAAGRLPVTALARMDFDDGDPGQVERLERRAASLERQIRDASAMIAPQRDVPADPVEAATRRAHEVFREVTRARFAEAQAARPQPRRERPFAPASGCPDCEAAGATRAESAAIHAEMSRGGGSGYDAEITRLVDAGYSLATARQAAIPAGYR